MLVDSHCHLFMEPLCRDVSGVLRRARDAGVSHVVVPAYDAASFEAVAALAEMENVHPAFGLHPWVSGEELDREDLARRLSRPGTVAVGEVGLDFAIPGADRELQMQRLSDQLDLADDLGLPVLLHCRGAFEELYRLLDRHAPRLRGVLHAYSRSPQTARPFVERLGCYLGLGGAITRERAARAQATARELPLRCFLLETDAPSIGLHGVLPEQTEPRHVADMAQALARLRGESMETIRTVTGETAQALFGISIK